MREDADAIVRDAIEAVLPDEAVRQALRRRAASLGDVYVVAAGKAAWQMARAASDLLGDKIRAGVVCTKYGHVMGELPRIECHEGGHPVPDENSFAATQHAVQLVSGLAPTDTVLFLLSGGGSALFELPLCSGEELANVTRQLLASGADITQVNTIRKRLSRVKGGRFARLCAPAHVLTIVLSDILGDPLDMIASGPAYPDDSTCEQALAIADAYNLELSDEVRELLGRETPKMLNNVETLVTGSVRDLCRAAADACRRLGYEPEVLTDELRCEARDAGSFLASVARSHQDAKRNVAFIAGGETVVHVRGAGLGGRNQELALAAAEGVSGLDRTAVFSVGSDGTDGPTDAAGGFVDDTTATSLREAGVSVADSLAENDAYHALEKVGGLVKTGPTGTNVNDVAVVLIRRGGRGLLRACGRPREFGHFMM